MEADFSTLHDLSIIHPDDEQSLLKKLDYCQTDGGRKKLYDLFTHPHKTIEQITQTQVVIQTIRAQSSKWPASITNGTIQMIDQFYAYPLGSIPKNSLISIALYQFFSKNEYGMVRFSFHHFCDFIKGIKSIAELIKEENDSKVLHEINKEISDILSIPKINRIVNTVQTQLNKPLNMLQLSHFLYHEFKSKFQKLKEIYFKLDAWRSMAVAMQKHDLHFPEWIESESPILEVRNLRHLLLAHPVGYDIKLQQESNFIFLTGANMAGKSTFIKSVGAAVYLAHIGMGVPANTMKLSLFGGIISNIQVQDNISKGESYFYNEVQRVKTTLSKITDGRRWLVLIDELFKGTNIQDAMLCSKTVIEGLAYVNKSIFILSTHLYEIGEDLKKYPNILFRYFETISKDDQISFSYQLKEGISDDRFGYLILKNVKVTDIIRQIKENKSKDLL